ncbi:MAG: hypothetical protein HLUCCA12_14595 [Rhodobacteraceae bacterium HLUCCA12]|nr:MAG: hypothetical protein HLUCCA12_14595 [Rhodobacteraceae bacterium HLUCCA12]
MQPPTIKTTAVFCRPFVIAGFDETLPAGEYDLETEISTPPDHKCPERWKASVLVRLHPRNSHPGLARSLTIPLSDLENALARDKFTGGAIVDFFVEEMLADPMVRLVMRADRVSEAEIRTTYARNRQPDASDTEPDQSSIQVPPPLAGQDRAAVQVAENEGMPTRPR